MKLKKTLKIVFIVMLVLAVLLGGSFCVLYFNGLSGMRTTSIAADGQIKVACVGDSITYGHGISNWPANNYPALLQDILGDDYVVNNYGVSGYAVQESSDKPYTSLPHYQQSLDFDADIVVFMMGSNDAKTHNWQSAEVYKADLIALLESYGDARILLCTPATAYFVEEGQTEGATGYGIQPLAVEEIAQTVRQVAAEAGYTLVDINDLTDGHAEWFKDGVHPVNEGAAAIAARIAEVIEAEEEITP